MNQTEMLKGTTKMNSRIVFYVIGVSQLVLGALYLFAPQFFVAWQGLSEIGQDINYPLAMLAGRFFIYGVGMFVIARDPEGNQFWLKGMIAIQAIDLAAGLFYTLSGVVPVGDSIIPMVDAAVFIVALLWANSRPRVRVA